MQMIKRLLHAAMPWAQRARLIIWFFTRPSTAGVHAVALTPAGKIVLVKLTYQKGWRLPGGGRRPGEGAEEAVRRELKEEIGLIRHGELVKVGDFSHRPDFNNDRSTLFVLRDVVYRPSWSMEIKAVREFDPDRLPADTAPITRRLIARTASLPAKG